ncbi:MAG: hypothetical protein ACI4EX_04090 [Lachnospiraceae bacterium]
MELKEAIGIVEYMRENVQENLENEQLTEIRDLLMEILFEMREMNGKTENKGYEVPTEDLPF